MADRKIVGWFTSNGQHVPITEGQTRAEAYKEHVRREANNAVDKKDREIEANKQEAEKQNDQQEPRREGLHKVDAKVFREDLNTARNTRPVDDRWRVDNTHTVEDFNNRGCRCYISQGGSTVAVDRNGDIISVCRAKGDKTISGAELLRTAVRLGGNRLDSFYGNHEFYCDNGFQPVSWTPFNPKYAPDGWRESGCSQEPVVFYRYVGIGRVRNTDISTLPRFDGDDGYERAQRYRDNH